MKHSDDSQTWDPLDVAELLQRVIDTATDTVVGSPIPVGDGVFGIAVIPDARVPQW